MKTDAGHSAPGRAKRTASARRIPSLKLGTTLGSNNLRVAPGALTALALRQPSATAYHFRSAANA